jgi:hypothetical protein
MENRRDPVSPRSRPPKKSPRLGGRRFYRQLQTNGNVLVGTDLCVRPEERGHTQVSPHNTATY